MAYTRTRATATRKPLARLRAGVRKLVGTKAPRSSKTIKQPVTKTQHDHD